MKIRQAVAVAILAMTPALTGCLRHTYSVMKTRPPDVVLNSTLDQLLQQLNDRNAAIQSMTLFAQMSVSRGGGNQGEVTEYDNIKAYIIIGSPDQIRVILLYPLYGKFLDMVSDGKSFKMEDLHNSCVITGSDVVTNPAQKGIYSLRPAAILDSLLIRGFNKDDLVSMTQDSRILENPQKKKDFIDEPDYDIEFLSEPKGQVARTLRVLHVSRADLLPYRQDIYNAEGKIETKTTYSNYQKFGEINFPTKIVIERPLDELGLTITLDPKTNFNQKLESNEFTLDPVPQSYSTYNMDDPAVAATVPCAAHAPQSTH
jgi:outer membrane lipoprotein-sorting protein